MNRLLESILDSRRWRDWLGGVRLGLALGCLVFVTLAAGAFPTPSRRSGALAAATVYAVYALAAANLRPLKSDGHSLLSLIIDTIFFLVWVALSGSQGAALASVSYFYILLAANIRNEWPHVFVVTLVTVTYVLLSRPGYMDFGSAAVVSLAMLLAGVCLGLLAMEKQGLENRLASALERVEDARAQATRTIQEERSRIAADFHDGPLQSFVGVQLRLQVARKMLDRDFAAGQRELEALEELVKYQSSELRAFVREMRPVDIGGTGLIGPIRKLVEGFEKDSGIKATLVGTDIPGFSNPQVTREVLHIVREALHNAQKHSRASRISVAVAKESETVEIAIEDNGTGFPFSGCFSLGELESLRLGPASIRNRVRGVNGDLQLESWPGKGSALKIRIPA